MDLTVLDQIIIGRVDPHIYAFTTNTIPNYLTLFIPNAGQEEGISCHMYIRRTEYTIIANR